MRPKCAGAVSYRDEEIAIVMVNELSRGKRCWYAEKCALCGAWHVREFLGGKYLCK